MKRADAVAYMADNKDHSISLDSSVGGGMRNASSAVRTESLDPTTIETYTETDPSGLLTSRSSKLKTPVPTFAACLGVDCPVGHGVLPLLLR